MSKFAISISILLLLVSSTYSQSQKSKKDFNKDGVIDQVTITEDGGSSISTKDIKYIDGKTKKKYEFSISYSFGSFFAICNIPNVLGKSGRESLGNLLFGQSDSIDPSLNWLIDVSSSEGLKYNPIWISGEPQIPESYYTILESKKYEKFLKNVGETPDSGKVKPDYFWIDYNTFSGHHFSQRNRREDIPEGNFKISKIDSSTWVYNTANGVILKKGNKYSWVFIGDNKVISADEKFRWTSIHDVKMINDYVLVLHRVSITNFLYIINPITGYITSLDNEEIGINSIENMKVDKAFIELMGGDGEKYSMTLDKINELFKEAKMPEN